MTITAKVRNGAIELPPGTQFPEGATVEIRTVEELAEAGPFGWMLKHAGVVDTLPPDFGEHHDDYIHGRRQRP